MKVEIWVLMVDLSVSRMAGSCLCLLKIGVFDPFNWVV